MNKKGKVDEGSKKKARKAQKFQKAIVGMSLDDIKKKKAQRPELRAQREKEAKEAKAKAASQKKTAAKPAVPKCLKLQRGQALNYSMFCPVSLRQWSLEVYQQSTSALSHAKCPDRASLDR